MITINPQIFREYDIRGIADRDLSGDAVFYIGKAYGTFLKRAKKHVIALGRDCRVSSPRIHEAFRRGVLSTGLHVVDIGLCTTPCLYFSIFYLAVDGGVMITGSHNPPDHNGIKMCIETASLFGSQIQELKQLIDREDFETGEGTPSERPMIVSYKDYLEKAFSFASPLKVVVDCGNGMTGLFVVDLLKKFGHQVTPLYVEPDGAFPNHPADPSEPKNLEDLIHAVAKEKADVGLAFDGDGDRVGVVDSAGSIIPGDQLMILFSRSILKECPGATVIADVKCSNILFKDIEVHGGRPIMWKTGHSLIKAKMKEEGALLAGEMSGHMFFRHRWFGFDSGVYAALRVLEIIDREGKKLSDLLADVPNSFSTPEIRVPCPDDKKFQVVKKAAADFKSRFRVVDIDGARVEFPDGWGLVRASNTQPVLVMRFEAESKSRLQEIRTLIEGKIQELTAP
jgi:phosphomannomutase/phosphoglucomutase